MEQLDGLMAYLLWLPWPLALKNAEVGLAPDIFSRDKVLDAFCGDGDAVKPRAGVRALFPGKTGRIVGEGALRWGAHRSTGTPHWHNSWRLLRLACHIQGGGLHSGLTIHSTRLLDFIAVASPSKNWMQLCSEQKKVHFIP
jgi:hypothetical protein